MSSDKPKKINTTRVFGASTLLALVISVPAVSVTLVMHYPALGRQALPLLLPYLENAA